MCNYSVGPVCNELPQTITDMTQRSQDKCITLCLEFLVLHSDLEVPEMCQCVCHLIQWQCGPQKHRRGQAHVM
jgi:hypothetical protein